MAVTITPSQVNMIDGLSFRGTAGAAGSLGDLVYMASDGTLKLADAGDAIALSQCVGMVVAVEIDGASTFSIGQELDVQYFGRVFIGDSGDMTVGNLQWVSETTAGDMEDAAPATTGEFPFEVGRALKANILMLNLRSTLPVAVA